MAQSTPVPPQNRRWISKIGSWSGLIGPVVIALGRDPCLPVAACLRRTYEKT